MPKLWCPIVRTWDGHDMEEGEVMWRVSNSDGKWRGEEPARVVFSTTTGYNKGNERLFPYDRGHIHFFDYAKAKEFLKKYPQGLPTVDELNHWIALYKREQFYCPCQLGRPFYPDDSCQCGG